MTRRTKLILTAMAALTTVLFVVFLLVRADPAQHEGAGADLAGDSHGTARVVAEPSNVRDLVPTGPPLDATAPDETGPSSPAPDEVPSASGEVVSVPKPKKGVTRAEGERNLARLLGLKPAEKTAATELLRLYSAEELALLARVQRVTKRKAPKQVFDIITMRRKGASYEELVKMADRALSGNLLARSAVRKWLRQHYRPAQPPDTRAPAVDAPRVGGKLRLATPPEGDQ